MKSVTLEKGDLLDIDWITEIDLGGGNMARRTRVIKIKHNLDHSVDVEYDE